MKLSIRKLVAVSAMGLLFACDGTEKDLTLVPAVTCASPLKVLNSSEAATIEFEFVDMDATSLTFGPDLESDPGLYYEDYGTIAAGSTATQVAYTAPALIDQSKLFNIEAVASDGTRGLCRVLLIPPDGTNDVTMSHQLAADDGGPFEVPVGKLYALPSSPAATAVPDFSNLTHYALLPMKIINSRAHAGNFLGIVGVTTNFAVRIDGKIKIETAGNHRFRPIVGDKSTFYLNDVRYLNNVVSNTATANIALTPGDYAFTLDFYQDGTGNHQVRLEWALPPTAATFTVIPAANLKN